MGTTMPLSDYIKITANTAASVQWTIQFNASTSTITTPKTPAVLGFLEQDQEDSPRGCAEFMNRLLQLSQITPGTVICSVYSSPDVLALSNGSCSITLRPDQLEGVILILA